MKLPNCFLFLNFVSSIMTNFASEMLQNHSPARIFVHPDDTSKRH